MPLACYQNLVSIEEQVNKEDLLKTYANGGAAVCPPTAST